MKLTLIEQLSEPGAATRPNEDALGATPNAAFVIDGATGLAETRTMAQGPSDAAWLAGFCAAQLELGLQSEAPLAQIVRRVIEAARAEFFAAGGAEAPRYAWPTSAFQLLRLRRDGVLETAGLGDCRLILRDAAGVIHSASGPQLDRAREQAAARAALERTGGFATKATERDPVTLGKLREGRARQNTEGGYWTLGLEPAAADHLAWRALDVALPARGVLMSDGFVDLIDLYEAYSEAEIVSAIFDRGLSALATELRRFEREIDPEGARFARFKQSDDATAIAFTLG
ncbi:MAG: hypothetical protein MRY74_08365 [Neomegalonema sp.]|nr:hypothetical protein [Neomegalonema sp.]